jgi:uridine kinase
MTAITLIIDGPSGAGKTTLAASLEAAWPQERTVFVLHMDDLYPGWQGLRQASDIVAKTVIPARTADEEVTVNSWDWAAAGPGSPIVIPANVDLIIEGCGALTKASARGVTASIWLDAEEGIRKSRALSRGNEDFQAHWDEWDAQFQQFVAEHDPRALASVAVGAKR